MKHFFYSSEFLLSRKFIYKQDDPGRSYDIIAIVFSIIFSYFLKLILNEPIYHVPTNPKIRPRSIFFYGSKFKLIYKYLKI